MSIVTTINFKNHIVQVANGRGDKWGEEVSSRLTPVNDLVASDGRYHQSCIKRFLMPVVTKDTSRRSPEEKVIKAFEHICNYIENKKMNASFS